MGIPHVNGNELRNSFLPIPLSCEQEQIARFLDHETGKIDALIEKQQALIALLQEKRQAVISHAVTKGLNPDARMKDSGVEWLGEVPEHWRTGKFTHYIQIRHGHQFRDYDFTDEGIKIIKITQLHRDGYLDISSCSTVASGRDREFPDIQIREHDVLMCLTGGTIGKIIRVGEVHEPLLQNYRVGHFSHANQLLTNDYIYYLMSSDVILRQINFLLRETGQPNIGMEDFGGMKICIPCLEEQDSICSYIEESLPKFDNLISHAEMQVNLLQERRTALISAAVTGKIDVRDWEPAPEA
jgi:type I restriction enzyme S subunit